MEWLSALGGAKDVGAGAIVVLIIVLMLTDRLVAGSRLRSAEAQRDRWENIALTALGVADRLTGVAEVTNTVLSALPDPAREARDGSA